MTSLGCFWPCNPDSPLKWGMCFVSMDVISSIGFGRYLLSEFIDDVIKHVNADVTGRPPCACAMSDKLDPHYVYCCFNLLAQPARLHTTKLLVRHNIPPVFIFKRLGGQCDASRSEVLSWTLELLQREMTKWCTAELGFSVVLRV